MWFSFAEAWELYNNDDFGAPIFDLKRAHTKMTPRINAMKAAVPKLTVAPAAKTAVPKIAPPARENSAVTRAKLAFKSRVVAVAKRGIVMERKGRPLPPDRHCISFDGYTAECDEQWEAWNAHCGNNWTPMCESVAWEWFSQDLDWVEPTRPDPECAVSPKDERMTADCMAQWENLWDQCYYETDPV